MVIVLVGAIRECLSSHTQTRARPLLKLTPKAAINREYWQASVKSKPKGTTSEGRVEIDLWQ